MSSAFVVENYFAHHHRPSGLMDKAPDSYKILGASSGDLWVRVPPGVVV